jgi:hypothetical protein
LGLFIDYFLKPCLENDYNKLVGEIRNGDLILETFEELIRVQIDLQLSESTINGDWKLYFRELMKLAGFKSALADQRIKQFELYLKLKNIKDVVSVLCQIKRRNGIAESYEFLENLAKSVSYNEEEKGNYCWGFIYLKFLI